MKKYRYRKAFQRALSAFLCLSMVLSLFVGTGLTGLYSVTKSANAEDSPTGTATEDKYPEEETLEYLWSKEGNDDPDKDFLDATRPYYDSRGGSFGGVNKRTIFHVFAFEGDTICIGSSIADSKVNMNFVANGSGNDKGSVDIVMTDLNGVTHAIDIRNSQAADETEKNTTGYIGDWQTEWAAIKYLHKENGKFIGIYNYKDKTTGEITTYTYTPYTYTVTETGVYTFEFHSYNNSGTVDNDPEHLQRSQPFHDYKNEAKNNYGGEIAAINLTVFDESGDEQHGRTFADCLSMQMHPASVGIVDTYYILTTDSYIYKMKFNNAMPYTYNFFANNKGLYDSATGEIIYSSVKDVDNNNTYARMGAAYKYPGTKDTDMLKSYYIFLEYPDDQLEGEMYEKPVAPDPATNVRFVSQITGDDGEKVTGAYVGEGGYFAFDVEEATTATLRLEFKGELGEYAPVEISGAVTPHTTNYFYWNGKDGNGETIPIGTYEIKDLAFTVTTKAGEIHFPIIDMESAPGGITFERMSHIYSKDGVQLDTDTNIYGLTKNLIYYDDTAIYYGEPVASTGFSEEDVGIAKGKFTTSDNFGGFYFNYNNISNASSGENIVRKAKSQYVTNNNIRVGDHSHTTNVVNYFDNEGKLLTSTTQQDMIDYLDSSKYPVGKSTGGNTTTDYAIANFWTFIPSQPASASGDIPAIVIKNPPTNYFNLTGRVFFDADESKTFDDMIDGGDYGLSGVTLNLYKKTSDTSFIAGKTYVSYDASKGTVTELDGSNFAGADNKYELVDSHQTTGDGMYRFTGLAYDPEHGTEYLYQVVKPLDDYTLTTGGQNAAAIRSDTTSVYYGYYADKSYNTTYKGTEVQHIVVGGTATDHVDPTKITCNNNANESRTVCAVDVGYNYTVMTKSLELKKSWDTETENHPTAVAYEIKYHLKDNIADSVYKYRVISAIDAWSYEDEYLPTELENKTVDNYYVSAEYYFKGTDIYKHEFKYNSTAGKYESFVGTVYKVSIEDLNKAIDKLNVTTGTDVKNFSNIPDLSVLSDPALTWTLVTNKNDTYRAVLDRNVGSDKSTITVTNAEQHGTIEIFKYYNDPTEANALQGATFRIYKLDGVTLERIKELASSNTPADIAELRGYQVGSGTTRANGRIAFPGLDPSGNYVIREVSPPAGYRILNEFYEVRPYDKDVTEDKIKEDNANGIYYFNEDNYIQVDVGNAPADSNFYILKRIEGRAWQTNDSFSFSITNAFDKDAATTSGWSAAEGIQIETSDLSLLYGTTQEKALEDAEKFAVNFNGTGASKININDTDNDYYSYKAEDQHVEGQINTYTYPDRKMSVKLLTDGKGAGEGAPTFCGIDFPFAGTYTFTITENDIEGDTKDTLTKSEREYTVTITCN